MASLAVIGNKAGDADAAIATAARTVEAVYAYPYQAHAAIEPMNATALYTPDKCEVWAPTQNGEAALAAFRNGQRPATVMDRIAKGFSDAEILAIANWYGTQAP